ncbi:hypothetical protein PR202_gb26366 [Eleusine coracana subsp. coracana]|uniref:Thiamine pyrophosphate enzyme TPP-binding domain-containing protein n=1 Tax=Eleusine coracana subsp. coracana TaxID=191504 RepID=A0AAV5FRB8_ELECO|nr:hypothetical protein PR202_gb26366 [Eleusine coracana subsp. coracana]
MQLLMRDYEAHGHMMAALDPLGLDVPDDDIADLELYGFTEPDLDMHGSSSSPITWRGATALADLPLAPPLLLRRRGPWASSYLIHGDGAYAGQGVWSPETLNLSALCGYTTGGTIHIVLNNRVAGCTDVAKALSAHRCYSTSTPMTWRRWAASASSRPSGDSSFHSDVVVDLVYYELEEERENSGRGDVAICRTEQLCPFPYDLVQRELKKIPK